MQSSFTAGLVVLVSLALAGGCTPGADTEPATPAEGQPGTRHAAGNGAQPAALTDANLQAYARALEKQAEIIRRPGRGTHYGVTMSIHGLNGEAGEVLEAAGMTMDEFKAVHGLADPVLTTLNFQGEIGPPRSIDVEAAPEWKERLAGDPFDTLPPESAAALRRHMDIVAPAWSAVIALTAQHGR